MTTTVTLTRDRRLTRRGVLWLGLHCDVRCKFCYDELVAANEKAWMPVAQARARLAQFRDVYGNEFVDFMGGEPTLHPQLPDLLQHAAGIGLRPTIITHGMRLADPHLAAEYAEAGLHDVLMSVHGIGERARDIHGRGRDNFAKQLAAMANLRSVGIPFRFNVTLIRDNLDQLELIADLAADQGARVVNFLTFNPYFEWSAQPDIPFQARHSDIAVPLARAIDRCTAAGVEANVRYMPICQLPGREQHVYTGFQLPYDEHEWDYNSWYGYNEAPQPDRAWYLRASREQQVRHHYQHPAACQGCALIEVCDGFHEQYLARWGDDEARPYAGARVTDPTIHIRRQDKLRYLTDSADLAGEPAGRPSPTAQPDLPLAVTIAAADGRAGHTRSSTRRA